MIWVKAKSETLASDKRNKEEKDLDEEEDD
jgi:hypothetical protein